MAHVPAKFHPDIFNIKTKLDNYDYAYNNNNNNKEDKIQLFQNPIPLQGEWDNKLGLIERVWLFYLFSGLYIHVQGL